MKRWIDTIVGVVIGTAIVAFVALSIVGNVRVVNVERDLAQLRQQTVSYEALIGVLLKIDPARADSVRQALGIPPEEVRDALDSLRVRVGALEER